MQSITRSNSFQTPSSMHLHYIRFRDILQIHRSKTSLYRLAIKYCEPKNFCLKNKAKKLCRIFKSEQQNSHHKKAKRFALSDTKAAKNAPDRNYSNESSTNKQNRKTWH